TFERFGNPSSVHWAGREVREKIEWARERIAKFFGCDPLEIVFTSSGTEADNLAIKGVVFNTPEKRGHVITSSVEHPAVRSTCRFLEKIGCDVTYLPVGKEGFVDPDDVRKSIRKDTVLISVMYANNETGVVNPVREIANIARERGILFHTDAVQAIGKLPCRVEDVGADIITFSAHKINALKGTGGIYVRKGLNLEPLIHGGHQERGRRAGTENVVGIIAMGKAFDLLIDGWEKEAEEIRKLRDAFENGILERIEDVVVNGSREHRLPNTTNLAFRYVEGEALLVSLDMVGIAASAGSACTSGSMEPSYVLTAMGVDPVDAQGSLRFSLGYGNTMEDVEYALEKIPEIVSRLRELSPLYSKKAK
ncbi:MAG: cysteine desulfurase, partial [Deltaproteobacteria bacterium]